MLQAGWCIRCHRLGGEGGDTGPVLDGLGARYTAAEVARAILEPDHEIPETWKQVQVELVDGTRVVGQLLEENPEGHIRIRPSPWAPDYAATINTDQIVSRGLSERSSMPAGLVNGMNPGELAALLRLLLEGSSP